MRRVRRILVFALFLLIPSVASAESVTGRVVDPQGMVVMGATVNLSGPSLPTPRVTTTEADGTFAFEQVAPGRYSLRVESAGFISWVRERLQASDAQPDLHQPGRDPELELSANVDRKSEALVDLAGWIPFVHALERLRDLSKEQGFPVVTFSTVEDKTTDGMIRMATERGCTHVRLLPEIQA